MTSNKAFYLTTPIYYVNDAPHIGHAYTTVAGDLMTRWHRMAGEDVWFLTGTDEHGQKVLRTAVANNTEPQAWADKLVEDAWLPVLDVIDAANDDFIRTTQPRHTERVQRFLASLKDAGHIYKGSYEGPYCVGCEEFKLAGDLIAGEGDDKLCPIHSKPVEQISETNYFFKLSAFANDLIAHYEANPQAIRPESAYNEVMSFLRSGLQDLSISRSTFDWGIDVPWDPSQVVYVWFDALLNYATAVGLGDEPGSAGAQKFAKTWPADVHLVGKDILRFHAVIWPAMLMAADLPLPKCVFAHGWLLVGGEKMSKSKLTGISPQSIVDLIGSDAFRYYFMRAIIFGQDGSFSWEDLVARYTAELANGLGNLASRVQAMVVKNFEGSLPAPGELTAAEKVLTDLLVRTAAQADTSIRAFDFQTGIVAVKEFIDAVNLYVTEQEPWTLAKKEDEQSRLRLATILYTVCESLRAISILYSPLMPKSMAALWSDIGASESNLGKNFSDLAVWGQLVPGVKITKSESLFPRIEEPETI
ncbi:MAG: methionine--tRNA ligase [Actinomycetes bacterium]